MTIWIWTLIRHLRFLNSPIYKLIYVDQYQLLFNPPIAYSLEKPISTTCDSHKNMAESRGNNSSSSDSDSLLLSEKNISTMVINNDNKANDINLGFVNDEVGSDQPMMNMEPTCALSKWMNKR